MLRNMIVLIEKVQKLSKTFKIDKLNKPNWRSKDKIIVLISIKVNSKRINFKDLFLRGPFWWLYIKTSGFAPRGLEVEVGESNTSLSFYGLNRKVSYTCRKGIPTSPTAVPPSETLEIFLANFLGRVVIFSP